MSQSQKNKSAGTMLEMWRPPAGAGEPIGCLTSTFTFSPSLFDEQCLARFLEIESEPDREDLAFLLERENRLGGVYAGVLVDHTMAGVEHSLRWDVLPVRISRGKQHSKVSLLFWSRCIRAIVASANLSESGYRRNFEVATSIDFSPEEAASEIPRDALEFLRKLISLVPGANHNPPQVGRALKFLAEVEHRVREWAQVSRGETIRRHLVCTVPSADGESARSSLDELFEACRKRGDSPQLVKIASPFFDVNGDTDLATAELCKKMARGKSRKLVFAVPSDRGEGNEGEITRLAAPKSLIKTAVKYVDKTDVEILPASEAKNQRPWHGKMVALSNGSYVALMIGSSNFTCAGLGIGSNRNAEANVLTLVDRVGHGRQVGALVEIWPKTSRVEDPDSAEWAGANADFVEEEQSKSIELPPGFLYATFQAGDRSGVTLQLDPFQLPEEWRVYPASGPVGPSLFSDSMWTQAGKPESIRVDWMKPTPPEKLMVIWSDVRGYLPINVEDVRDLPPPNRLENMTADDMLGVLAATDPSAAIRAWAKNQVLASEFDEDLDVAGPIDLDPLRRYELGSTFLHRVRRRARKFMQMRSNLERPVWGIHALEWRLRGPIGIGALADRLFGEFRQANGTANEALLALADFLIVLRGVKYQSSQGALSEAEFVAAFTSFLKELALKQEKNIQECGVTSSEDALRFWKRVVESCQN